jgi:hypothetical protein
MAFSASAIFRQMVADTFAGTSVFDLNAPADVYKVALYNNTGTPDKDATAVLSAYNGAASAWVLANEVSQAVQWPVGGVAAAGMLITTPITGVIMLDATDTASGAAATLANVFGSLLYDDTRAAPVADQGICFNYFGGTNSVTNGTMTVVWNVNGLFRITV